MIIYDRLSSYFLFPSVFFVTLTQQFTESLMYILSKNPRHFDLSHQRYLTHDAFLHCLSPIPKRPLVAKQRHRHRRRHRNRRRRRSLYML